MTLLGVNLRVSGYSSQGGRKYMEDSLSIAAQETKDGKELEYAFFAVYDGHGGKEASLFAKEHLMDNIVELRYFWSDDDDLVLKAIRDGFLATHLAMWKELDTWPKTSTGLPSTSGTTASIAFIRKGKLYIGHVGDSRIVLGYSSSSGTDQWQAQSLTTDHKPDSALEKKRIYESGGLVMKKSGIDRVVWKRPKTGHQGPVRRSTDFDKIPFLAVARSLGDLWSYDFLHEAFVVSPEPDVSVITLNPDKDHCLVIASDGLWNTLTPSEAVILVQESEKENDNLAMKLGITDPKDPLLNNPSKVLVNCALERWNKLKMRADNTSVITVVIEHLGVPKTALHQEQDFLSSMLHMNVSKRNNNPTQSVVINENFNCQDNCSFVDNKSCVSSEYFRTLSEGPEIGMVENYDSTVQRSSSSPLQSLNISNEFPVTSSRHTMIRNEVDGTENNPYPIPRWSKSASGQTSLSKIARWSMLVSHRCTSSNPLAEEDSSDSVDSLEDIPLITYAKLKQKHGSDNKLSVTTLSNKFLSSSIKECCECSMSMQTMLPLTTVKHLSSFRQTAKRKYTAAEVACCNSHNCFVCLKCECSTPWKRKPVVNSLNITAFKAINDFRMSQYHRLKF